ncbi:MAG: SUMF1/EgtB/PvdO family nonheme iron enzyme [Verrucomicrobiota bacterium]|nr:SUMF1/EgtB/PvdO family nonheme iron enzyme [Verrucomicrobiota bacterium]
MDMAPEYEDFPKFSIDDSDIVTQDASEGHISISKYMENHGISSGLFLDAKDFPNPKSLLIDDKGVKYKVLDIVEKGGMGTIFRALDMNCRRIVAFKIMHHEKSFSKRKALRFIEEAQITAQLEHPNIVPVHELGVAKDDKVYYTMKFVNGLTLREIINRLKNGYPDAIEKYPLSHLLNIFLKICDALALAHSRGVIHRDLTPANIMVGDYGEVQVMDWGLAKILKNPDKKNSFDKSDGSIRSHTPKELRKKKLNDLDKYLKNNKNVDSIRSDMDKNKLETLYGKIMGTPVFMAPEQAQGETDKIDSRTDIYALGAILYNILTLQYPFRGNSLDEIIRKIIRGDMLIPFSINTDSEENGNIRDFPHCPGGKIPASLSAVVMKAMSGKPEKRYFNVEYLQKDIEAYQGGFATSAESASLSRQMMLFLRRHKTIATNMIIVIILIFSFMIRLIYSERKARKNADDLRIALVELTNEKKQKNKSEMMAKNNAQQAIEALNALKKEQKEKIKISRISAKEFILKSTKLMEKWQWEEAEKAVGIAIGLDNNSEKGWYLRGLLFLGKVDFENALKSFRKALSLKPYDFTKEISTCIGIAEKYRKLLPPPGPTMNIIGSNTLIEMANEISSLPQGEKVRMILYSPIFTSSQIAPRLIPIPSGEIRIDKKIINIKKSFWITAYEVSQKTYEKIMGENPSYFKDPDKPVETVSWNEAILFCKRLTDIEQRAGRVPSGYQYRLPTEQEWEFACRSGKEDYSVEDLGDIAWFEENSTSRTHKIGLKRPNKMGLYDMLGNVWEWCSNKNGTSRIVRGGGWSHKSAKCTSSFSYSLDPDNTYFMVGFRPVLAKK